MFFRVAFFIVLLTTFLISGYYRKKARTEGEVIARKDEGYFILILRMVFGLALLASLLLYVFAPHLLAWAAVNLPAWVRYFFTVVAYLCIPMIYWVFRSIGTNISETILIKDTHQLVTTGAYQWVRHPLYASTLLLLCALSIMAANVLIFAYFVLALVLFRTVVIPQEEKRLIEAFGAAYQIYQNQTGAIFPRVFQFSKISQRE